MLSIHHLFVSVEGKEILRGIDLEVKPGEIHAIMGPNGSGKSTFGYALMGHTTYQIANSKNQKLNAGAKNKTKIVLDGFDLSNISSDERAKKGLFLAFQNPLTIEGVSVFNLLKNVIKSDIVRLHKKAEEMCKTLGLQPEFLTRSLNDGFSGGEKKKMEMLQMLMLKPKYAIVDEIDTGLDVDALATVAQALVRLKKSGTGIIIITHYQRILKYLVPDKVHVMVDGKIVKSGTAALAKEIEDQGYQQVRSK